MNTMSLRGLARKAPDIKEDTLITFQGKVIGTYKPAWGAIETDELLTPERFEEIKAEMEEPVKKAIEPDKTRVRDGKLRKGLGDLPGEKEARALLEKPDSYHSWNPAPKPGKK